MVFPSPKTLGGRVVQYVDQGRATWKRFLLLQCDSLYCPVSVFQMSIQLLYGTLEKETLFFQNHFCRLHLLSFERCSYRWIQLLKPVDPLVEILKTSRICVSGSKVRQRFIILHYYIKY